jgi:hypothetical protein
MAETSIPPSAAGLYFDWPCQKVPMPTGNSLYPSTNFVEFYVEQVQESILSNFISS